MTFVNCGRTDRVVRLSMSVSFSPQQTMSLATMVLIVYRAFINSHTCSICFIDQIWFPGMIHNCFSTITCVSPYWSCSVAINFHFLRMHSSFFYLAVSSLAKWQFSCLCMSLCIFICYPYRSGVYYQRHKKVIGLYDSSDRYELRKDMFISLPDYKFTYQHI